MKHILQRNERDEITGADHRQRQSFEQAEIQEVISESQNQRQETDQNGSKEKHAQRVTRQIMRETRSRKDKVDQ